VCCCGRANSNVHWRALVGVDVKHHMDPGEILNRGRAAALDGHHEQALRDIHLVS